MKRRIDCVPVGDPVARVVIADDHSMIREALRRVIETREDLTVVAEAADGQEAVEQILRHRPEIAIIDLWMPRLSGVEATRQIVRSGVGTRVLILTMHDSWSHVRDALRAGASGYVVKAAALSQLLEAIDALREGKAYVSPSVASHVVQAINTGDDTSGPLSVLTDRERQVLQLIAEGLSSKEVAAQLGFSVKTAEAHRSSLMSKLGIHKTSALVRFAIREGLISP